MSGTNKAELLRKVKALADRGVGGEREGAQALLARLMDKYGITEADIEEERRDTVFFPYSQEVERRLLHQIIYMVTGSAGGDCVGTYTNRKRKKLGADVTAAERLEIEANYGFFKEALKKELDIFLAAFAHKNRLFPSPDKVKQGDNTPPTPEDRERALKIGAMMEGMDRHTLLKMLQAAEAD